MPQLSEYRVSVIDDVPTYGILPAYQLLTPQGETMKNFDAINGNTNKVNSAAMAELNAIALDVPVARTATSYTVTDRHTKKDVSTHTTRRQASRKQDRLDNAYGGYRYGVRINWES